MVAPHPDEPDFSPQLLMAPRLAEQGVTPAAIHRLENGWTDSDQGTCDIDIDGAHGRSHTMARLQAPHDSFRGATRYSGQRCRRPQRRGRLSPGVRRNGAKPLRRL